MRSLSLGKYFSIIFCSGERYFIIFIFRSFSHSQQILEWWAATFRPSLPLTTAASHALLAHRPHTHTVREPGKATTTLKSIITTRNLPFLQSGPPLVTRTRATIRDLPPSNSQPRTIWDTPSPVRSNAWEAPTVGAERNPPKYPAAPLPTSAGQLSSSWDNKPNYFPTSSGPTHFRYESFVYLSTNPYYHNKKSYSSLCLPGFFSNRSFPTF
jgi:hypothetical protein